MTSSAFSNQPGGLNSEGTYDGASPAGCSLLVDGGTFEAPLPSSLDRGEALTGRFHYALHLRGFDTNWKQNLFCHKRLSITHRESDYA